MVNPGVCGSGSGESWLWSVLSRSEHPVPGTADQRSLSLSHLAWWQAHRSRCFEGKLKRQLHSSVAVTRGPEKQRMKLQTASLAPLLPPWGRECRWNRSGARKQLCIRALVLIAFPPSKLLRGWSWRCRTSNKTKGAFNYPVRMKLKNSSEGFDTSFKCKSAGCAEVIPET